MADDSLQDKHDRTESPTPRRLEEARRKGQVPRSRELAAAAVVMSGGLGLYGFGVMIVGRLAALMRAGLTISGPVATDPGRMLRRLEHAAGLGLLISAPLIGLLLAAALLAPLALGGWTFSGEALTPDFGRLNPVNGLGRVFSIHGLIELGKALARFSLVALVAALLLRAQARSFLGLTLEPVRSAIGHALQLSGTALIALGGALGLIALVDVPLAIWQHRKSLRMTRQEVREESRETEGAPETRARVRRAQQAQSRRRMMQQVPRADVVVTNPTHYAVALRYEDGRMRAPIVLAKGQDRIALRIREIAAEHRVVIVEAAPLARALYSSCDLGDEVPARLYAAVARVLTYVYQLRAARRYGAVWPEPPRIDLPE